MILNKILKEIIRKDPQNEEDFLSIKREIFSKYKMKQVSNAQLLKLYNNLRNKPNKNNKLREILKKRKIRTMSGVAPIAVLTKASGCPGNCVYCPNESKMPKSYLSNEPAVMRAIMCNFNPFFQVQTRIKALRANGHDVDKIEIIVMGGTWSAFPKKYQYWFLKEIFRAANSYSDKKYLKLKIKNFQKETYSKLKISDLKKELKKEQKRNEKAKYRIVGLTLETRPDNINFKELKRFRELGCTRVEIGVQAVDDKILKHNKRGHGVKEIVEATKFLRQAGFKIVYHLMPNLPGATVKKDLAMFKEIFNDQRFLPDQIKIYPCVVVKGAELYDWWKRGKYKPYSDKQLEDLLVEIKKITPYFVRIVRLIRDIPTESIEAGNKISNLRQTLQERLHKEGTSCKCIRCREARKLKVSQENIKLFKEKYETLNSQEIFLSYESRDRKILLAFLRLSLPKKQDKRFLKYFKELNGVSLIRELHTYGQLAPLKNGSKNIQHRGLGKMLMKEAEGIVLENNFKKMAVISGVGVREYYRKLGYRLQGTYMIKKLK